MSGVLALIAVVLPLALDTFAVSAALGVAGVTGRQRMRLGLVFASFEAGMPLIGLALGAALGTVIGAIADYLAIAALAGLGAYMLFSGDEQDEAQAARFASARGPALVAAGVSVSLDELAIGFALGLTGVPIVPALVLIAAQAFVASQLGFALGARVGESLREGAERLAGVALLLLAALLLIGHVVPHAPVL